MKKTFENAVISFGEWLQEQDSSYAIFVVKGDKTRFMLSGDTADVISSITTAILNDEQVRQVIVEAVNLAAEILDEQDKNLN